MKNIVIGSIITGFAALLSPSISAADICDTQLAKQLELAEKQNIRRPLIRPSRKMARIMDEDEILCPLQVEKDFNGDNQTDWFGIIEQNKSFYLVAYLSGKTKYNLSKIKQYEKLPANIYFDTASKKTLKRLAGIAPMKQGVNFVAIENQLGGKSTAYAWDGKRMQKVIEFKFTSESND